MWGWPVRLWPTALCGSSGRPRTLPEGVGAVGAVAVGGDGIGVHGENVETGRVLSELVELAGPGWGGQCRCDENDGHNLG